MVLNARSTLSQPTSEICFGASGGDQKVGSTGNKSLGGSGDDLIPRIQASPKRRARQVPAGLGLWPPEPTYPDLFPGFSREAFVQWETEVTLGTRHRSWFSGLLDADIPDCAERPRQALSCSCRGPF